MLFPYEIKSPMRVVTEVHRVMIPVSKLELTMVLLCGSVGDPGPGAILTVPQTTKNGALFKDTHTVGTAVLLAVIVVVSISSTRLSPPLKTESPVKTI